MFVNNVTTENVLNLICDQLGDIICHKQNKEIPEQSDSIDCAYLVNICFNLEINWKIIWKIIFYVNCDEMEKAREIIDKCIIENKK